MKIAIIGAGPAGLACALECEKLGVVADIYERDYSVGWTWPSIISLTKIFYNNVDDILTDLKKNYRISITPLEDDHKFTMKSPGQTTVINGDLGFYFTRGKNDESLDNQLRRQLRKTPIHYNNPADYKRLTKEYDYVVVASGKDTEAAELGVWEDHGQITMIGGIALGNFNPFEEVMYFDTEYAGTGYGRLSSLSSTHAVVGLYIIGHEPFDATRLFSKFLKKEGLESLEFMTLVIPPVFNTGKVKQFKIDNILLAGRAAGLTDRTIGLGVIEAMKSGVLAARAIIEGLDYDEHMKPLQEHIENISSFRNILDNFTNEDFDKMLKLFDTPGIKQLAYNTGINFADAAGYLVKKMYGEQPDLK